MPGGARPRLHGPAGGRSGPVRLHLEGLHPAALRGLCRMLPGETDGFLFLFVVAVVLLLTVPLTVPLFLLLQLVALVVMLARFFSCCWCSWW